MRDTRLGRVLGMSPSPEPDLPAAKTKMPGPALIKSGIFDLEYYSAGAGETFPDRRTAARHCFNIGMPSGLSPSPFLARSHLPKRIRQAWSRGQVLKVLEYLVDPASWRHPYSPIFDPAAYLGSLGYRVTEERSAPLPDLGGLNPLGHLLAAANEDTLLPVPADYARPAPTVSAARRVLIDHARDVSAQGPVTDLGDVGFHAPASSPWRDHDAPTMAAPGGPLVSIIAPLPATAPGVWSLESIAQMQVLHRWELLLVGEPRDGLSTSDGRTRIVAAATQPGDETVETDWRNVGIDAAEGEFVAFLPPGHHWRPEFLRAAVQRLTDTERDCGQAGVSLHDPSGRATVASGAGDLATLRAGGWMDLGALVARTASAREAGGFGTLLGSGAEPEFALRMASRASIDAMPFIASDRMLLELPAGSTSAAGADGDWLAVLGAAWVDWDRVRAQLPQRTPGRISIVIPTYDDARMTVIAARSLLATTSVTDIEVTIVDNGSPLEIGQELVASFSGDDRVHYTRLPVNLNFAIACNVGFAASSGERVVFLNNDTRSDSDWLPALLAHLDDETVAGAQPVLVYDDRTIQTAGSVFPLANGLACHFLVGLPVSEAAATSGMRFDAATAAALALRAADVAELAGFDAHFINGMEDVDLCLRLAELRPGGFRVEPASVVTHFEGKTPGRGRRIPQNRRFFMDRWDGRLPGPELEKFAAAGYDVVTVETDGLEIPSPRPIIHKRPG